MQCQSGTKLIYNLNEKNLFHFPQNGVCTSKRFHVYKISLFFSEISEDILLYYGDDIAAKTYRPHQEAKKLFSICIIKFSLTFVPVSLSNDDTYLHQYWLPSDIITEFSRRWPSGDWVLKWSRKLI